MSLPFLEIQFNIFYYVNVNDIKYHRCILIV